MSIAKEMWDYLKSIGFVDIPNNDERLGCQGKGIPWSLTIARDNLCAYQFENTIKIDRYIFLIDQSKTYNIGKATDDLNIHTVQDLENWLRKEYPEFYKEESMITKDNIGEVLKHNSIETLSIRNGYVQEILSGRVMFSVSMGNPNLIPIIEAHIGKKLKPLPKDYQLIGKWIRCVVDGKFCTGNKWYRVHKMGIVNERICVYKGEDDQYSFIIPSKDFNLTDIRDYNPNEHELKIGDVIETKERKSKITKFGYMSNYIVTDEAGTYDLPFLQENALINGKKYDKLTIPPFDFEQKLLDAGFTKSQETGGYKLIKNGVRCDFRPDGICYNGYKYSLIKPTPANAKILIEAAEKLNKSELME